jgi:hypothetical protein
MRPTRTIIEPVDPEKAAAAVWEAHGLVMNGGVLHAVHVLRKSEVRAAISGLRLFGLPDAASALEQGIAPGADASPDSEAALDELYNKTIPGDGVLEARIAEKCPPDLPPSTAGLHAAKAIEVSIARFIEASSEAVNFSTAPGKIRFQHKAHDRAEAALSDLLRHWDRGGHDAFRALLNHHDNAVRVSAAAYLAVSDADVAIPVLKELDEAKPPVSLTAFGTLFAIEHRHFDDPLVRLRRGR